MSKRDIYGPDLSIHEDQAAEIATTGMKIMRGNRTTGEAEKSDGPDASVNGLERLMKKGD